MEIVLVLVVLAVIAAAAFLYMRSRNAGPGLPGRGRGPELRGRRGAARAARHDPMAEAVERHAQATDPHEAAEAELRLQAQANRVAADLHARQASSLESQAGGRGLTGRSAPAGDYGAPAAYDEAGRPLYEGGAAAYQGGAPAYEDDGVYTTKDGKTIDAMGRPVRVDDEAVYENGQPPAYEERQPVDADDGAAYYDEQGRPVQPEDRPRY